MWSVQLQVGGQSEEEIAKGLVPLRFMSRSKENSMTLSPNLDKIAGSLVCCFSNLFG